MWDVICISETKPFSGSGKHMRNNSQTVKQRLLHVVLGFFKSRYIVAIPIFLLYSHCMGYFRTTKPEYCIFIQSHGLDTKTNYTEQRFAIAETWGQDHTSEIFFVTDGKTPSGFSQIALNTTSLRYDEGPIAMYKLMQYMVLTRMKMLKLK